MKKRVVQHDAAETYFSLDLPDEAAALDIAKKIAASGSRAVTVLDAAGNEGTIGCT